MNIEPDYMNILREQPKKKSKLNQKASPIQSNVKIGRNEKCPCGSGKKYKKCCLLKHQYVNNII